MFKDILSTWQSRVTLFFLTWRIESVRTCCAVSVSIEHFSNSWQCKSHTMLKLPQSFSKIFFLIAVKFHQTFKHGLPTNADSEIKH